MKNDPHEKDVVLENVFCARCGQRIHYFIGRPDTIVCATCCEKPKAFFAGNTNPSTHAEILRYEGYID